MKKNSKLGGFQGDVVFHIVDKVPKDAVPTQNRVVALGEATGHNHVVTGPVVGYETPNAFYFVVAPEAPAVITHQEHAPIEIAPGLTFQVPKLPQVEYDGAEERRVAD